jgi:hypothetical protein
MTTLHRPSGHALLGTMASLVLMMLLWIAAFGHLSGYLRAEKEVQARQDRITNPTRAMAWAFKLLETGTPPSTPYSCRMGPDSDPAHEFVATFQRLWPHRWSVSIRPSGPADSTLPLAPESF